MQYRDLNIVAYILVNICMWITLKSLIKLGCLNNTVMDTKLLTDLSVAVSAVQPFPESLALESSFNSDSIGIE